MNQNYPHINITASGGAGSTGIYCSGTIYGLFTTTTNGNGTGILFDPTSHRNSAHVQSIGNSANGVAVLAGGTRNRIFGVSYSNGANVSDAGTSTDVSALTTA